MKEQTTKIETFRSHLLDRVNENRVTTIGYNADGNPTFIVDPEFSNYTWVLDLADRAGLNASGTGIAAGIVITEERTDV